MDDHKKIANVVFIGSLVFFGIMVSLSVFEVPNEISIPIFIVFSILLLSIILIGVSKTPGSAKRVIIIAMILSSLYYGTRIIYKLYAG